MTRVEDHRGGVKSDSRLVNGTAGGVDRGTTEVRNMVDMGNDLVTQRPNDDT